MEIGQIIFGVVMIGLCIVPIWGIISMAYTDYKYNKFKKELKKLKFKPIVVDKKPTNNDAWHNGTIDHMRWEICDDYDYKFDSHDCWGNKISRIYRAASEYQSKVMYMKSGYTNFAGGFTPTAYDYIKEPGYERKFKKKLGVTC